jgi:hypothetical protein
MALYQQCQRCHQYTYVKLTAAYARWYLEDGKSTGYVVKVCDECLKDWLVPALVLTPFADGDLDSCPLCGVGLDDYPDVMWLVLYARRSEQLRAQVVGCSTCVGTYKGSFVGNGRMLPDREATRGQPQPAFWSSIGIEPVTQ